MQLAGEQDSLSAWRAGAALALIESGREDEARELALAEDFQSVPWDQIVVISHASLGRGLLPSARPRSRG